MNAKRQRVTNAHAGITSNKWQSSKRVVKVIGPGDRLKLVDYRMIASAEGSRKKWETEWLVDDRGSCKYMAAVRQSQDGLPARLRDPETEPSLDWRFNFQYLSKMNCARGVTDSTKAYEAFSLGSNPGERTTPANR